MGAACGSALHAELTYFAALLAIKQAVVAQAHAMVAEAEIAETIADTTIFRQIALHADEWLGHGVIVMRIFLERSIRLWVEPYFCNARDPVQAKPRAIAAHAR